MIARNHLFIAPPHVVAQSLNRLGANLRTARIRRRLTLKNVSQKIGAGVRAIADAEKGKPSTGIAIYFSLLWAYGLLHAAQHLADPAQDAEGQILALAREPARARTRGELDNDF